MLDAVLGRNASARTSAVWVVLCALALALVGLLAQIAVVDPTDRNPQDKPVRQVAYLVAAGALAAASAAVGYRRAVQWSRPLLWVTWAMLAVLLLPGMPRQYGAARWLDLGPVHLQPSEVAKLTMILFLTGFAVRKGPLLASFTQGFLPALLAMGVTGVLVRLEPDLGQTLLLLALSGAVLMANGLRLRHAVPVFLALVPLVVIHALTKSGDGGNYVEDRVRRFLEGSHYQVQQGLGFFAVGGLDGAGLEAHRAHLFVPKIHNDFILVAVGEVGGFLASSVVVLLFVALFGHGLRLALLARDRVGFSVAFGISVMIGLQAAVNIAVVTGSVPPKGMSLPFLSYGGSSLLVLGISVGLLASVAADALEPAPGAELALGPLAGGARS